MHVTRYLRVIYDFFLCFAGRLLFNNLRECDIFYLTVINGDFSADAVTSYTYMVPSGWKSRTQNRQKSRTGGSVLVPNGDTAWGGGNAVVGVNYLALQGNGAGISQFCYIPRGSRILFHLRYRPNRPPTFDDLLLIVSYGADTLASIRLLTTDTTWTEKMVKVPWNILNGDSNKMLQFRVIAPFCSDSTAHLDNVRVVTPESVYVIPLLLKSLLTARLRDFIHFCCSFLIPTIFHPLLQ